MPWFRDFRSTNIVKVECKDKWKSYFRFMAMAEPYPINIAKIKHKKAKLAETFLTRHSILMWKETGWQKIFPLSANYRRERGNIYNKKAGVHNSHIGLCLNRNIYDLERHQSRRHLNLCDVSDFLAQQSFGDRRRGRDFSFSQIGFGLRYDGVGHYRTVLHIFILLYSKSEPYGLFIYSRR